MERDTIDLLKELVAIDSQNPSLVAGAAGPAVTPLPAGRCCCAGTWTPSVSAG